MSGPLGSAAAGLAVLLAAEKRDADECDGDDSERSNRLLAQHAEVVDAHRLPNPDLSAGVVAARAGAHAMTDVSDGLVEELETLAAASNVALAVDVSRVPRTEATTRAATELGESDDVWALTGGEDHQLLAAFAASDVPSGWVVIGDVRERTGDRAPVSLDGIAAGDLRGWQSF